jgi:hypothetical protein
VLGRLDFSNCAYVYCLESSNEHKNQNFSYYYFGARCNVSRHPLAPRQPAKLMLVSASTATIVRIPYIKNLSNAADFLYATTDIAIWSTAETGMGLAASSFATLRPLFRDFFQRSRLMGGTSSRTRTGASPWPTANGMAGGYIRSRSKGGIEEFGLRSDVGKNGTGVTTVIESDVERAERGTRKAPSVDIKRQGSLGHMRMGGWNNSKSQLTDLSSDEGEAPVWDRGIRKTTVQTQSSR